MGVNKIIEQIITIFKQYLHIKIMQRRTVGMLHLDLEKDKTIDIRIYFSEEIMTSSIHPTAIIDKTAVIEDGV